MMRTLLFVVFVCGVISLMSLMVKKLNFSRLHEGNVHQLQHISLQTYLSFISAVSLTLLVCFNVKHAREKSES